MLFKSNKIGIGIILIDILKVYKFKLKKLTTNLDDTLEYTHYRTFLTYERFTFSAFLFLLAIIHCPCTLEFFSWHFQLSVSLCSPIFPSFLLHSLPSLFLFTSTVPSFPSHLLLFLSPSFLISLSLLMIAMELNHAFLVHFVNLMTNNTFKKVFFARAVEVRHF